MAAEEHIGPKIGCFKVSDSLTCHNFCRLLHQKAGNPEKAHMKTMIPKLTVSDQNLINLFHAIAPIEQNINGQNGFYQLEYSRKASKSLLEFKKLKGQRQISKDATDG